MTILCHLCDNIDLLAELSAIFIYAMVTQVQDPNLLVDVLFFLSDLP